MKDDEKEFLIELQKRSRSVLFSRLPVRDVIAELKMNEKRAAYILEKWADKDWYGYGVSVFAGWLTNKGMEI